MLISITLPASTAASAHLGWPPRNTRDELVLIELQGALDTELTHPRERDGRFVGTLSIDDAAVRAYSLLQSRAS